MSSWTQLKGNSATGKGSRVCQLVLFLATKYKSEIVYFDSANRMRVEADNVLGLDPITSKKYEVAIKFPEIKLLVMGKFVKSNKSGLIGLTGLDIMVSEWPNHDGTESIFLPRHLMGLHHGYNFIAEGYPSTLIGFYHPSSMMDDFGITKQMWNTFYHSDMEALQERVVGRSGKRIKATTYWSGSEFEAHHEETLVPQCAAINNKIEPGTADAEIYPATENICNFGVRYLNFIGANILVPEFMAWSMDNSVLRDIKTKQDLSIFPRHLFSQRLLNTGDSPEPISQEEFNEKMNTPHENEPKTKHAELLVTLTTIINSGVKTKREFNGVNKEHGISALRYNIKYVREFIEEFGDIYDCQESQIVLARLLEIEAG